MALDRSVLVPRPERGTVLRTVSGKTYVYYATAVYRNEKGQPTCERSSIGRLDEETGMLIPNRNYYEIYLKQSQPMNGAVMAHGVYHMFMTVTEKLGLTAILKKYFPDTYKEILTAAQYMLSEGNVMAYVDNYTESHDTAMNGVLSDVQCSKLFASIRQEDILLFMRDWMKQRKTDEYVAYDVTSISSYGKQIEGLEWGYNRDKEKLPQINMGLYYGEESGLPLYYRIYPGSISDKAHLQYMVADNELIRGKKMRYVMDRGFYSADNLQYLVQKGHRFVIALPGSLSCAKELIHRRRKEIVNVSKAKLGNGLPYGKSYDVTELGFRMRVHVYYDPQKALQDSEALYELLERQENDLSGMETPPDRKYRYDKYFLINRTKDGKMGFVRNHKAIDEALERCGFFLIAETDFQKTSKEILQIYRNRDTVEKSFDNLKNDLDCRRLHVHNVETMYGKLFTAFLSLIVRSYMQQHKPEPTMPQKKLLLELDKIKTLDLHTKNKPRLLNPITKSARTILQSLDIPLPD